MVITASASVSLIISAFDLAKSIAISGFPDFIPPPAPQHWHGYFISLNVMPGIISIMSRGASLMPCPLPKWHGSWYVTVMSMSFNFSVSSLSTKNSLMSMTCNLEPNSGWLFLSVAPQPEQIVMIVS